MSQQGKKNNIEVAYNRNTIRIAIVIVLFIRHLFLWGRQGVGGINNSIQSKDNNNNVKNKYGYYSSLGEYPFSALCKLPPKGNKMILQQ